MTPPGLGQQRRDRRRRGRLALDARLRRSGRRRRRGRAPATPPRLSGRRLSAAAQGDEADAARPAHAQQVTPAARRGQRSRRLVRGRHPPVGRSPGSRRPRAHRRRPPDRPARPPRRPRRACCDPAPSTPPAAASASAAPSPASARRRPRPRVDRATAARPARRRPSACRRPATSADRHPRTDRPVGHVVDDVARGFDLLPVDAP